MNDAPEGHTPRLAALFEAARALGAHDREGFLEREAPDDPSLRAKLHALLAAHDMVVQGADRLGALERAMEGGAGAALLQTPAVAPGDQVGRYRILRPLGSGGAGAVWLAHDPVLDREVALKLLAADGTPATAREALLAEARAAAALDHPGIATVHEVGEDEDGRAFLAMASYSGGSLRERLQTRGRLPLAEALEVGAQVAEALHAAHARGIVHRDVKPENLVFDARGRVKVVDFGVAAAREGSSAGTPGYRSPEQEAGGVVDARSDLYALGVVLHEMHTGRRPGDPPSRSSGDAPGAAFDANGAWAGGGEAWAGEGEAPEVDSLFQRLLDPDPACRPADAATVARELRRLAREAEAPAPPPRPGAARWHAPGPRVRVAAALLLGVALAVAAGVTFLNRDAPRLLEARGSAGEAFAPRGLVLVGAFTAPEGLEELALAAREALVVDLQQSGFVRVLPRGTVDEVLLRMGLPPESPVEGRLALEVAERAGAGAVLETTVARAGTRFVLGATARHPQGGEELFSVRTSAGERGLLGAVERLSREVRARLGEAGASLAESRPLPQVTTASLEALRLYTLAERVFQEAPDRAASLLEAALEVDPGFAMAHRLAAGLGVNQQRFEVTTRHLEAAWEHRERLPDRERWLVEAARASEVTYDPYRAEALYQRIVARFPDEFIAWANLGNTRISWLDDPEGALEPFARAMALDPDRMRTFRAASTIALSLGDLAAADALAEAVAARLAAQAPEAASDPVGAPAPGALVHLEAMHLRWQLVRAYALADLPATLALCETLLEAGHPPEPQADDREFCGSVHVVEGDRALGRELLESVLTDYLRQGRHRNATSAFQGLAMADLLDGDTARARSRFHDAVRHLPPEAMGEPDRTIIRVNLQLHAAVLGWADLAEAVGAAYPPHPDPENLLGRGGAGLAAAARALHLGDPDQALAHLEGAFPPGVTPMGWRTWVELLTARALEDAGEPALAAVHYERAANRGWAAFGGLTKDRLNLVLAQEGLARTTAPLNGSATPAPPASGSSPGP
jgi:tetratricopeptide (TPR) repeat protein